MRILLVWIGIVTVAATGRASERVLAQVTQPIGGSGAGILLADVSYVDWFNIELDPWPSVRLTTAANCVPTDDGTEDLNLANKLGLRVSLAGPPSNDPSNPQCLRGDTLDVVLSISPNPGESQKTWMR